MQMLLQHLFLRTPPPLISKFASVRGGDDNCRNRRRRRTSSYTVGAGEEESHFEVDPDKAREALQKLDQQLQTLSQKNQVTPPRKKVPSSSSNQASDLNRVRDLMREETPEFSGSFLAYSAFALLLFTIFYNLLFITVIQPSIDKT